MPTPGGRILFSRLAVWHQPPVVTTRLVETRSCFNLRGRSGSVGDPWWSPKFVDVPRKKQVPPNPRWPPNARRLRSRLAPPRAAPYAAVESPYGHYIQPPGVATTWGFAYSDLYAVPFPDGKPLKNQLRRYVAKINHSEYAL